MFVLNDYEINKLDHIETTLEKSVQDLIYKCGKNIAHFEADISGFYENAEKLRCQEKHFMIEGIQNLVKSLKSKIDLLKENKISGIKDFEKFKAEMVNIQDNILNMKRASKSTLNKLKSLENYLNDELNIYYNEKVAEWSENLNISSTEFVCPRIKNKNSGQCKEVKQFFDYVHQSGGHENGWRREDHLLFLKLRGKYKKTDDLAFYLHEILPDISIDEIKAQEEWYKKYLSLQLKKKDAISRWKQNKNNSNNLNKEIKRHENNNIPNQKEDSLTLREKLMQWKIEKEEKLFTEKELEKQKIYKNIDKERIKRQKQIEIKKIVYEWKESKVLFEQSQKHHQRMYEELDKKRKAADANKLIKQFQSMDELHILKMRQINKKFTDEPIIRRVQSGPPVLRDPKRLMQPTVQWAQRVRAIREPLKGPLPILATPKLAIPEWRKSIM